MSNRTFEEALAEGEFDGVAEKLFQSLLEQAVLEGKMDPRKKNREEFKLEAIQYLKPLAKRKAELRWITNHIPDILKQARLFARLNQYNFSCLLYATYFEHWLNSTVATLAQRKNLSEDEITQVIRETQFRAKSTWLLRILGFKKLNENHLKMMHAVIEARNSFIHYKWKSYDPDNPASKKEKETLKGILNEIEKTVRYLQNLHNRHLLYGKKRELLSPKFKIKKKKIRNDLSRQGANL